MAFDWDAELLGPVMSVFGEGMPGTPSSWPIYTPKGGSAFQLVDAVFDSAYHDVTSLAEDDSATSRRPVLGVRAVLFTVPPAQNDTVFIPSNGMTYGVTDARPDGHGHIKLMLIEVA